MTLIEQLQTLLTTLATGGAHYQLNEASPLVQPYIVFQRVVGSSNNTFDGPSDLQATRVQVDVYGLRISDVDAIAKAAEAALLAAAFPVVPLTSQDLFEADTRLHRRSSDYSCWLRE